ncbi:Oidioi.mRNA.OKI2018_I69.XSR.g16576.t1.cds [Oikopleura dioica]|uniref:Oidioi.mRNA.OKI2018_I69.XSR.g16576.t1.cds n=1 Tax=Oikopleura dioica TaxID=34765 RepID=A0ABN7SLN7_OIKDI|nr:Oidioi.mRNA.OKI2018_I69.XSR.g16576.t1.cds [Oikopleura dioica]
MSSQSEASSVRSVTPKTSLDQSLRTIPQDSFVTDGSSRTKWDKKNENENILNNDASNATTSALANLGESFSSFCNSTLKIPTRSTNNASSGTELGSLKELPRLSFLDDYYVRLRSVN